MPKSRRRPAAAAKQAAERRRREGTATKTRSGFTSAPWQTWQEVRAHPDADADTLTVVENLPFGLISTDGTTSTITLAELASQADPGGDMADFITAQCWLADHGYLTWDRRRNSAVMTTPPGARNRG